jgi:hypothetical protein
MQIGIRPRISETMSTGPGEPIKHLHRYGWDVLVVLAMGVLFSYSRKQLAESS